MGLWNAIERVVTESNDIGWLEVVCIVYWEENEQDWSSLQFVSTATVLMCKFICDFLCNIELEFLSFYSLTEFSLTFSRGNRNLLGF